MKEPQAPAHHLDTARPRATREGRHSFAEAGRSDFGIRLGGRSIQRWPDLLFDAATEDGDNLAVLIGSELYP